MRTEDGHIIHKCINGEPEAFGFIVDKYKESIYAFAYTKLGNFHDAEDVTQEVFIKAFRKLKTLKSYDNLSAWLYAITSNICKDFLRSRSKRPDQDFIEDSDPDILDHNSVDSYRESLIIDLLHDALDTLPEIYHQVLVLHYLGNMNSFEIAKFTGIEPGSVRQRLTRARDLLKKEMLEMMTGTFDEKRLRAGFTFNIVETIKKIKINPISTVKGLPWGLSLATGILFTILSINPYISQSFQLNTFAGSPLLSETKVLKVGEIPVDVVKTSETTFLSSKKGNEDGGKPKMPDQQDSLLMAPKVEGDTWVRKADMPTKRAAPSVVVNGKIYAIGGSPSDVGMLPTVEEYDPKTDKWEKKADMPTARASMGVSEVNGKIYAIGGWVDGWTVTPAVEEYDPKEDKWTEKAEMPTARWCLSTCEVNKKIYAIGGWNGSMLLSTVEEYDPKEDKWTKKADMPTARDRLATSVIDGKIYAIGGATRAGIQPAVASVEVYDPATDTWTKKNDMPTARGALCSAVLNDKIYVMGGGPNLLSGYAIVEEYDPATDTWTKRKDMPHTWAFMSASIVDDKIYLIGGVIPGLGFCSVVEEYTPDTSPFNIFPKGKLPSKWGERKKD
jgi:RNA polymerase sigma factor (sigma-70 family)